MPSAPGQCPECQRPITIRVGDAEYFNGVTATVIVIAHTKTTKCDCGREFVPQITTGQLGISGLLCITRSPIITPSGNPLPSQLIPGGKP